MDRGFSSTRWMTYRQAAELGGQVKKGAKAESAFYVGTIARTEDQNGHDVEKVIPFLKAYAVFNCDEIEGLPEQYYTRPVLIQAGEGERIPAVDAWVANTQATINHGGGRAFYNRSGDYIQMPEFAAFQTGACYYATLLHEMAHWTGAPKRLEREKGKAFGDPAYAFEELVAELSAAYLCADLGITSEPREDHASYIAGWIKALSDDARNLFRAASHAERAAEYLHGLQQPVALAA
jgi:antirestriction protein ArdC